jgi:ribosomal protein S19E (S16A)
MRYIELRTLYLLAREGGRANLSTLSAQMARHSRDLRRDALKALEVEGFVASVQKPGKKGSGGRGALVVWLTESGTHLVAELVKTGEMKDPQLSTGVHRLSTGS